MNIKTLLFAFSAAAISSCSTTYKNGQTPDDVYFSPARPLVETVEVDEKDDRRNMVDRRVIMGLHDRRWRTFNDDFDHFYDPYRYGYTYGYYYNPYYYPSPVYIPGSLFINPKNTTPRTTNLGSYNYSNMEVVNTKQGSTKVVRSTRAYNNSNRSDNNFIRRVITPTTDRPSRSENNTRTYSPSNFGSSSPGRSSGAPVSRPSRGN